MNIKDFSQPTILTGKQYGTTVTIELDHSDTSIDEVMDGMLTIVKGLGYLDTTVNEWIKDKAKDIYDDEHQIVKDSLTDDWFDEKELPTECWCGSRERCDCISEPNDNDEYTDWNDEDVDWDWDEERIDIIGQNGNEGTHYGLATDEDIEECELNDRPTFDWNDEDFDWPVPSEQLKAAAQRYSEKVKANHIHIEDFDENEFDDYGMRKIKPKMDKSKVVKGKIKDLKK